jgi:4-hydroxybenzoate polyprenyltransferase
MRTIFTVLRVPNLLIIAFTFLLLRYLVFIPVYSFYSVNAGMGSLHYLLMITATLLIAASGYIGNDYFDVATDRINKPEKQYIGIKIPAESALAMALVLSFFAIILAVILAVYLRSLVPAALLLFALSVSWWYAIKLKKSLVWGNIAVSGMSAGTIAMAWLIENQYSHSGEEPFIIITGIISAVTVFAFLLSLMREIIKDIEDIEGDSSIKCKSLPIVKGIPFTKTLVLLLSEFTIILLFIAQLFLLEFSKYAAAIWLIFGVEIPLIFFLVKLTKAKEKYDFHKLSQMLKWIMLGGMGTIVAGQF